MVTNAFESAMLKYLNLNDIVHIFTSDTSGTLI